MPFGPGRPGGPPARSASGATFGARATVPCTTRTDGSAAGARGDATNAASVVRCSKIELVRMVAVELVEKIRAADDSQRLALFMQLRNVQDSIASMKHANALVTAKASKLAWVDIWTPQFP